MLTGPLFLYLSIFGIFAKVSRRCSPTPEHLHANPEDVHRRCSPCSSSTNYLLLLRKVEGERPKMLTPPGSYARARATLRAVAAATVERVLGVTT
jgi:hypothetical protein